MTKIIITVFIVVLHFAFNDEDISVWPRNKAQAYSTDQKECERQAAIERRRLKDQTPSPTRIVCEKFQLTIEVPNVGETKR